MSNSFTHTLDETEGSLEINFLVAKIDLTAFIVFFAVVQLSLRSAGVYFCYLCSRIHISKCGYGVSREVLFPVDRPVYRDWAIDLFLNLESDAPLLDMTSFFILRSTYVTKKYITPICFQVCFENFST